MEKIKTVALYTNINEEIKREAETYIFNSKSTKRIETDSLRKLLEQSIIEYIVNNPILTEE